MSPTQTIRNAKAALARMGYRTDGEVTVANGVVAVRIAVPHAGILVLCVEKRGGRWIRLSGVPDALAHLAAPRPGEFDDDRNTAMWWRERGREETEKVERALMTQGWERAETKTGRWKLHKGAMSVVHAANGQFGFWLLENGDPPARGAAKRGAKSAEEIIALVVK